MPDPIIADQNQTAPPPTFPEMTDIPSMPQTPEPVNVPPMVANSQTPKKKKREVLLTILGIFLLLGAVGAGVVLVGQKQLFQQKAANLCQEEVNGTCVPMDYTCTTNYSVFNNSCGVNKKCGAGCDLPTTCTLGSKKPCITTQNCRGEFVCGNDGGWSTTCFDVADDCPIRTFPPDTPNTDCSDFGGTCKPNCSTNENLVAQACQSGSGDKCCKPKPTYTSTPTLPNCPNTDCSLNYNDATGLVNCKLNDGSSTYCCPSDKPLYNSQNKACTTTTTTNCSGISCTSNSCTTRNSYNQTDCWVAHYWCQDTNGVESCDTNNGVSLGAGQSASYSKNCGVEQIDIYCPSCGIGGTLAEGGKFISIDHGACSPPTTPSTNPTPTPGLTAACTAVKVYDASWNLLNTTQLSALTAGDVVRFTVSGTPADQIDKARFTINGVVGSEVTTKKPSTQEYYTEYTIPAGVTSFTVTAQIHHLTLGWF